MSICLKLVKRLIKVNLIILLVVIAFSLQTNSKDMLIKDLSQVKLVTEYAKNTIIDEMETVKFGSYPQSDISGVVKEPIEWIVLDRQGNKSLLLSKHILDGKCYNNKSVENEEGYVGYNISWEECDLRKWLNDDFYNKAFNSSEQENIQMTNVINNDINFKINFGNDTKDKIFCLSVEETRKYFGSGSRDKYGYQLGKNVAIRATNYAKNVVDNKGRKLYVLEPGYGSPKWCIGNSYYWLRTQHLVTSAFAARVLEGGYVDDGWYVDEPVGVRPALWVVDLDEFSV